MAKSGFCVTTGHSTTNSAWGGGTIVTPPYDIDDHPESFTEAELSNIINIWRAVAEDYSPFDVDITTEYPGSEGAISVRAAIGGSSQDWYGMDIGGIAYVVSTRLAWFPKTILTKKVL